MKKINVITITVNGETVEFTNRKKAVAYVRTLKKEATEDMKETYANAVKGLLNGTNEVIIESAVEAEEVVAEPVEEAVEVKAVESVEEKVEATVEPKSEYDPWILVTGKRKDKTALFISVFEGDSREKLTALQSEGYTFVCLSKVSAYNRFLGNNFKGGKGIVDNLNRKGVADVNSFVTNILAQATLNHEGMTITIDIEGKEEQA